jgi:transcriptional regulator with XRE-family HTH domain
MKQQLAAYLRTERRKSGLTQLELAILVGLTGTGQISRHERAVDPPSLRTAISYEMVFRRPLRELFPVLHDRLEHEVERRIKQLESQLQDSSPKGRQLDLVAQKLEWIVERRNQDDN